jgi:hypothetical protein
MCNNSLKVVSSMEWRTWNNFLSFWIRKGRWKRQQQLINVVKEMVTLSFYIISWRLPTGIYVSTWSFIYTQLNVAGIFRFRLNYFSVQYIKTTYCICLDNMVSKCLFYVYNFSYLWGLPQKLVEHLLYTIQYILTVCFAKKYLTTVFLCPKYAMKFCVFMVESK